MKAHLKRLATPRNWRIPRKNRKYITRPFPGAHTFKNGMSLNTVLIQEGIVTKKKEVKLILNKKMVFVDGKPRYDEKHLTGFMDVVSVPSAKKNFRITITSKGLATVDITDAEAKLKPTKVVGKSTVKGGKIQLHTMDGRNIIGDEKVKVGDTVLIEIPSQKVKEHLPLKKGMTVLLYDGKYAGKIATLDEVAEDHILCTADKEQFETRKKYAFVVGEKKPVVKIHE